MMASSCANAWTPATNMRPGVAGSTCPRIHVLSSPSSSMSKPCLTSGPRRSITAPRPLVVHRRRCRWPHTPASVAARRQFHTERAYAALAIHRHRDHLCTPPRNRRAATVIDTKRVDDLEGLSARAGVQVRTGSLFSLGLCFAWLRPARSNVLYRANVLEQERRRRRQRCACTECLSFRSVHFACQVLLFVCASIIFQRARAALPGRSVGWTGSGRDAASEPAGTDRVCVSAREQSLSSSDDVAATRMTPDAHQRHSLGLCAAKWKTELHRDKACESPPRHSLLNRDQCCQCQCQHQCSLATAGVGAVAAAVVAARARKADSNGARVAAALEPCVRARSSALSPPRSLASRTCVGATSQLELVAAHEQQQSVSRALAHVLRYRRHCHCYGSPVYNEAAKSREQANRVR